MVSEAHTTASEDTVMFLLHYADITSGTVTRSRRSCALTVSTHMPPLWYLKEQSHVKYTEKHGITVLTKLKMREI